MPKPLNKELKKRIEKNTQEADDEYKKREEKMASDFFLYEKTKKIGWWGLLIIVSISAFCFGFSILISYLISKNIFDEKTCFALVFLGFIAIFTWLILGYTRNKWAIRIYNDKRRRYDKIFTISEAWIKKSQKIAIIIAIILFAMSIIISII